MQYEPVIGLEVHAQLKTASKIFCGCSTKFGQGPNSQTCQVCIGMPGVLPVLNKTAMDYIRIKTGLAVHCEIAPYSRFARKNYFYPDLPKGYQISQYELPVCLGGYVDVRRGGPGETRRAYANPPRRGRRKEPARGHRGRVPRGLEPHRRAAHGDSLRAGHPLRRRGRGIHAKAPCDTALYRSLRR